METLRQPKFAIFYAGKNVTDDLTPYLIRVTYRDKVAGESDELEFTLEDTEGLFRDEWQPSKGDRISLSFGYTDALTDSGGFIIDEVDYSGPPDTVVIRALAAPISKSLRTIKSTAHEKKTLKEIVSTVAEANGFEVVGEFADITIERTTQNRETDLEFLKRLSELYGYVFSVRDNQLIFTSVFKLDQGEPVYELDRHDLISYSLKDSSVKTYKSATVSYRNPNTNKVVQKTVNWDDMLPELLAVQSSAIQGYFVTTQSKGIELLEGYVQASPPVTQFGPDTAPETSGEFADLMKSASDDALELFDNVENEQQAELVARSKLYKANTAQQEGSLTIPGNPIMLAGNSFMLSGMGKLSGKYKITESEHTMERGGGYVTSLRIQRVAITTPRRKKPVRKSQKQISQKQGPGIKYPPVTSEIQGAPGNSRPGFGPGNFF